MEDLKKIAKIITVIAIAGDLFFWYAYDGLNKSDFAVMKQVFSEQTALLMLNIVMIAMWFMIGCSDNNNKN